MRRMPIAGTLLIVLGVLGIVGGVVAWNVPGPAPHQLGGPDPSQMSWGVNEGARFIGFGILLSALGWWCWFPERRPRRKKGR